MNQWIIKDIFQWDIYNWSKALRLWYKYLPDRLDGVKVLEVGCGQGGLSLFFALKGAELVYCTDIGNTFQKAKLLHQKYSCNNIIYQELDVLKMEFIDQFNIVTFKSVIGGVTRDKNDFKKYIMINNIYKALKNQGKLLFIENLEGSFIHKLARYYFVKWGKSWNYLKLNTIKDLFSIFKDFEYITFGVLGAFGRNEIQRNILGRIDNFLEKILPPYFHYIIAGVAIK